MKRGLLGSTALIAVSMMALPGVAKAQTATLPTTDNPVKLGISGYLMGGFIANVKDTSVPTRTGAQYNGYKRTPTAVQEYGLIDFSGTTKFSNGFGAGVFIEFFDFSHTQANAQGTAGGVKRVWATVNHDNYGEIRVGDSPDARLAKSIVAPEWAPHTMFSANTPYIGVVNGAISVNSTTEKVGQKYPTGIGYYTPTIEGFQFAVSYAPDVNEGVTGPGPTALYNGSTLYNMISASLTWNGKIDNVNVQAGTGMTTARNGQGVVPTAQFKTITQPGTSGGKGTPLAYNLGFKASVGPWAAGAAFEQYNNKNSLAGTVGKVVDVGLTYQVNKNLKAGIEASRGMYKNGYGISTDRNITPILNQVTTGLTYILGPGVSVSSGVMFNDIDNGGAEKVTGVYAPGYDSISLLLGTNIDF